MICTILLIYLGIILDVPSWYFWTAWIALGLSFIRFAYSMYSAGRDHF